MKKYLFGKNTVRTSLLLVFLTMRTMGTVGVAVLLNYVIDTVSMAISKQNETLIYSCIINCLVYAAVLGLVIYISDKLKAATLCNTMTKIRNDIMQGVMHMSVPELKKKNYAEYITLLNQNLSSLEENYFKNILGMYGDFLGIICAVILLFRINYIIAIVSIIAMSIPSLIPKLFGGTLGKKQADIMGKTTSYNKIVKDIFEGFEVIKLFSITDKLEKKHMDSSSELEKSKERFASKMGVVYGLATMSSVAVQFLIMSLAGIYAVKGLVSLGSIIAVTQLTGQVISPAFQMSTKISQLKSTKPIESQVTELCKIKSSPVCIRNLENKLKLENVSFSYENEVVLEHLDAEFKTGKKYAVVGESGSGKSTLLKIISGEQGYVEGIEIDGHKDSLCDATMISQNVFLFDDTIRNNITLYGDFDDNEVNDAIKTVGLSETVDKLDDGLDTCVEENGRRFSGGERQRIALARALLYKKNLLLLDEVTSSLDNENASNVENNIAGLSDVTCISVMHRLVASSLKKYDEIYVMERGKLVEKGTFDELVKNKGCFYQLYERGIA